MVSIVFLTIWKMLNHRIKVEHTGMFVLDVQITLIDFKMTEQACECTRLLPSFKFTTPDLIIQIKQPVCSVYIFVKLLKSPINNMFCHRFGYDIGINLLLL